MKLSLCVDAIRKLEAYQAPDTQILIDLDDGVGPYSTLLMENGLKYRLLVVPADSVPADFNHTLVSEVGPIRFNDATAMYLDNTMSLRFDAKRDAFQLWSNAGLLESDLPILSATPQVARLQ
ncbi:iron-sulfur cluster biosynthesis family protein [Lacticaseibacillus pabuli]|uniref:Iron-sulfur cluster biosynthesis family protein n=1 Tax=Lacticaseibacillus pabuli TaxID=3025672 RepID=A0ABY7WW17_9LACO|nr:iron-sulfur cluster biosynthesis family protein [Lacticaseibacillus sp. KACC 23028]WDF82120.1 iron-sulfur cluster biosynthesis family protein [Lacticaseibacillus sp. KACC 23028]